MAWNPSTPFFLLKNLHNSNKSTNFAPDNFQKTIFHFSGLRNEILTLTKRTMTEFVAWDNDILTYPTKDVATQTVATDSLCVVQRGGEDGIK